MRVYAINDNYFQLKTFDESSSSVSNTVANKVVVDQIQSVKKILGYADVMRGELNDLVAEFASADSPRRKVGIYNRYVFI